MWPWLFTLLKVINAACRAATCDSVFDPKMEQKFRGFFVMNEMQMISDASYYQNFSNTFFL